MDDPLPILTVAEAAKLLRVSVDTVYEYAGRAEIPHRRVGRRLLFSRDALIAWAKGKAA